MTMFGESNQTFNLISHVRVNHARALLSKQGAQLRVHISEATACFGERERISTLRVNNKKFRGTWSKFCTNHFLKILTMCLYPQYIKNRKYLPNKKNGGNPPKPIDGRVEWVAIGCGNCIECRKQKANAWRIRLHEELKVNNHAYFVTNTFSNESLQKLMKESGLKECNGICAIAIRRFLERYRKKHGKSLRHWYITELGHENTERIHLHGIIFSNDEITQEEYNNLWSYGRTDLGKYCNARSINYIVKYVTKLDLDHKSYKAQIFASAGIGKNYLNEYNTYKHKYRPKQTREYYLLSNGIRVNLPIYYRNYVFSESQREKLWLEKLDQNTIYVRGIACKHIDTEKGYNTYMQILKTQQDENESLGYGNRSNEWQKEDYNITTKMLNPAKKGDFAK